MIDTKELRYLLGIITPDDAISQQKLDESSDYAMTRLDEVLEYADKAASGVYGFHAACEERAHAVARRLRSIRRDWLMADGSYRHMMAMG